MAYEKRLPRVSARSFISNGTATGKITVSDSRAFKVKQQVVITANTLPNLELEIKAVEDMSTVLVGPRGSNIGDRTNLTGYTTSLSAAILANEQRRPSIPLEEFSRAVFEEEPTVALRSILVDKLGNNYTTDNPLPVALHSDSINIGSVNGDLDVQLSHQDNSPNVGDVADSVRVGDGTDLLAINADGSLNVGNFPATQVVTGPVTDAEIRATPLVMDLRRGQAILFAPISVSSSGANLIIAADATKKIKVLHYTLVADNAVVVKFQSGITDKTGAMSFGTNGGTSSPMGTPAGSWLFETEVNEPLNLNLSSAVGVRGHVTYFLEA
jgi:hypothetical protein